MDTIRGFWAGAMAAATRVDLDEVAAKLGGWTALTRAGLDDLLSAGVPPAVARAWVEAPPLQTRGTAITRQCSTYPPALRAIAHPPPVLFVDGDVAALERAGVAIVGTRACSPYGAAAAHQLAGACARAGLSVISGLARGIDAAAHRGALAAGGVTVAVLGHGLDHTSPPSHATLRRRIVGHGGLVLTTFADPLPPAKWTFPARNRWIAALARRLVVIEAPERSGALITAERMLDLGRDADLYVVPGPLSDPSWRGSAALLGLGVRPLCDIDAFVDELVGSVPRLPGLPPPDWLSALFRGATVDEAARMGGASAVELMRELVALELAGQVVRLPGGRYAAGGGLP